MNNIKIKLTRDKYNFRFKQYEGMYFHCEIKDDNTVRYKITKDEAGSELKEFGNTHIKDSKISLKGVALQKLYFYKTTPF